MRLRNLLLPFALTLAVHPGLSPAIAQAPTAAQGPIPCSGEIHIVRVSEIQPGKMDTFLKAAAAQQAWYKSKGTRDQIIVMRVMTQGSDKSWSPSETQALTDHISTTDPRNLAHDADYDAFVKLFADSSTIKSTYLTCGTNQ